MVRSILISPKRVRQISGSSEARLTPRVRSSSLIASLVLLQLLPALAWVFPEHRDIAVLAIQRLDADRQAQLQKLWAEARAGHESRLCELVADGSQGAKPDCIDYAAWTAIAGDHSCSARDMLGSVLDAPWILGVARVSAKLKAQLAASTRRDQRVNAVRDSDIALERTDPEYVTRASSNNAHFLLARPNVAMQPEDYARLALGSQADLNALATYVWYHLRALRDAAAIYQGDVRAENRATAVLAALADEAFGLHFLEDSFAAGHVTGNWGNSAVRKGTHDYYSEHGVSLVTWSGHAFVAAGDAYMQPEDAERSAVAARDSLAQLIDAFAGKTELSGVGGTATAEPERFDVCHESHFPSVAGTHAEIATLVPIVAQTPVPALSAGHGEFPRFRAELGVFVGLSAALRGGALTRGFGTTQTVVSSTAGLESAARFGIGLEGILNESSDGLVFVEVGAREDRHASGVATVPGRGALATRLRMPFWLVPGDLLLAGPVLAFTSKNTLTKMAVQAANGGLIPWQAGIATRFGRLQFMLGREVGASFYRNGSDHPLIIPTPGVPPLNATLVTLKSVEIEFPILEYRLFRTFSLNQSSGLMIQPYIGFDKPTNSSVVSPAGVPNPRLHTIITTGIRVVFDWRHYLR
jgi:hypothetical protein